MGLFGKKKKDIDSSDYVLTGDEETNLPVAVAVPNVESPASAALAAKPTALQGIPVNTNNNNNNNQAKVAQVKPVAADPIVSTTTVHHKMPMSRRPLLMSNCPHCGKSSKTRTRTTPNWATWVSVGGIALIFWPVCWIPLCMDQTRETKHYCKKCGAYVGQVNAFTDCCATTH